MKITAVEVLSADRFNYVKVQTDEGLHGIGELHPASGTSGTPFMPRAGVQFCAEYLQGKDPLHIEKHWQHMFRRSIFRGGADLMAAIGALDIALWDIKGKACGRPVYELLGGPTRDKVRLYTHLAGSTPATLAAQAKARLAEGFSAVRLYPFGDFAAADFEEGLGLEDMSFAAMQHHAAAGTTQIGLQASTGVRIVQVGRHPAAVGQVQAPGLPAHLALQQTAGEQPVQIGRAQLCRQPASEQRLDTVRAALLVQRGVVGDAQRC